MALKDTLKKIGQKAKQVASSVINNAKSFVVGVTEIFSGNVVGGVTSIVGGVGSVVLDVINDNTTTTINPNNNINETAEKVKSVANNIKGAISRGLADNDYTRLTDLLINNLIGE